MPCEIWKKKLKIYIKKKIKIKIKKFINYDKNDNKRNTLPINQSKTLSLPRAKPVSPKLTIDL